MPKCPNCGGNREYVFVESGRPFGPYSGWEWVCKGCEKKEAQKDFKELMGVIKKFKKNDCKKDGG